MKKLIIVAAAVLLLIAASCKSSSNSQSSSYYPMAANDVWNHVLTMTTVEHGLYDTTITVVDSTTDTAVTDTTIAGLSAWKLKVSTKGMATTYGYLAVTSSEIVSYASPTDTMPAKVLALPLAQNATWIVDSMPATGKVTATVLDQENVTVPAGTYSAWKVEEVMDSAPTMPIYEWFGKGIGEAKWNLIKTQVSQGETLTITEADVMTSVVIK